MSTSTRLAFMVHERHKTCTRWHVLDVYEKEADANSAALTMEQEDPDFHFKVTQVPFHPSLNR